jgi:hypothetical protein
MVKSKSYKQKEISIQNKNNTRKHTTTKYFTHKQSKYGIGTFATVDIPVGTVILKETPYCLSKNKEEDPAYIFKLIDKFLSDKQYIKKFLSLVPESINCNKDYDCVPYEDMKYFHQLYLPQLSRKEIMLYFMKLKRNMFTFHNSPGICFIATRMNHSCDPNINYKVVGKELVFKTIKPIYKNDELFDSYIDFHLPKKQRQKLLLERYGFLCKCTKCNV